MSVLAFSRSVPVRIGDMWNKCFGGGKTSRSAAAVKKHMSFGLEKLESHLLTTWLFKLYRMHCWTAN